MKKFMKIIGSLVMILTLAACGTTPQKNSDAVQVITTSYALKYFIEELGGDDVEVVYSLTSNPHHFELSQADAGKIAAADIFFNVEAGDYVSIGQQIKNVNKNMQIVDVATGVTLYEYEGHEHDHVHDHDEEAVTKELHTEDEHSGEIADNDAKEEYDPHIWLDPIKAKKIVANIQDALAQFENIDKAKMGIASGNLQEKLGKLNDKFHSELANLKIPYIVVGHAAYGYLAEQYHFEQEAVNSAMDYSENTQTSMIEIDNFISEKQIKYVFVEPNVEANSAVDVLVKKHNLEELQLYNLETPVEESSDYFELMEMNLANVKKAMM